MSRILIVGANSFDSGKTRFAINLGKHLKDSGQSVGYFNLLTMGGPAGTTEVLGLYAINKAFRGRLFGYASALTTTLVLIILALVITPVIRIARERVEYL